MDTTILIASVGRPSLTRTLDSLLAQTHRSWEAIVALNNTEVNPAADYDDPRITFLNLGKQPNDYGFSPRLAAFKHAKGDYIATLDDDDWWEPSFLRIMRRELIKRDVDLLYCRGALWSRDGETRYGTWLKEFDPVMLLVAGYILTPSVFFRRELLEDYRHNTIYGYNSDWQFYIDRYNAGFRFESFDRELANLRVDEGVWQHWAPGGFRGE